MHSMVVFHIIVNSSNTLHSHSNSVEQFLVESRQLLNINNTQYNQPVSHSNMVGLSVRQLSESSHMRCPKYLMSNFMRSGMKISWPAAAHPAAAVPAAAPTAVEPVILMEMSGVSTSILL